MNKLLWTIPLLIVAATAVSSAAAAFVLVVGVSGSMKAAWRLQVCSYAMLIFQIYDWVYRRDDCLKMWRQSWKYIVCCGVLLGTHFCLFAESLEMTSIAHCLIFITSTPIALIMYALALGNPIYKWEVFGVGISCCGLFLVILDISVGSVDATWYGDLTALVAMGIITKYLFLAQTMLKERNSPLFAYFAPVNVIASLTAYFFAIFEGEGELYFSWTEPIYILPSLYLGLVPGVLGHLIINYLLSYISIILISVFVNLEPFIGGLIGWCFNLQATPSFVLWLGGSISIAGNMIVTVYGRDASEPSTHIEDTELTKPFK